MFRLAEAIAIANAEGKRVMKKDIAEKFWPDSNDTARQVNMTKLCNGKRKKIDPDWVKIVCDATGCTPEFLLGIEI